MPIRRLALPVLLAAPLLLAGCSSAPAAGGGAPTSAAPSASAALATGTEITGTGYEYRVPAGWGKPGSKVPTGGSDTLAADLGDKDGFADNVNVVVLTGSASPAQAESEGTAGLEKYGVKEVRVRPRVTVAGAETAHLSGLGDINGTAYRTDQYYVSHEGHIYVVTFSSSTSRSQASRDGLAASVLGTWRWS